MMNDIAGVKAIDGLCGGSTGTMDNCAVNGEIVGAIISGAVAGRAENSVIESRETSVALNGDALNWEIGTTETMHESPEQGEEEPAAQAQITVWEPAR